MEIKATVRVSVLVFCIILVVAKADQEIFTEEEGGGNNMNSYEEEGARARPWAEEVLLDAISLFTVTSAASPPPTSYLEEVRRVVVAYLFPPKIDFRAAKGDGKEADDGGGNALSKSLEKSKEIVEDSAKAAAEIARETLQHEPEL